MTKFGSDINAPRSFTTSYCKISKIANLKIGKTVLWVGFVKFRTSDYYTTPVRASVLGEP